MRTMHQSLESESPFSSGQPLPAEKPLTISLAAVPALPVRAVRSLKSGDARLDPWWFILTRPPAASAK